MGKKIVSRFLPHKLWLQLFFGIALIVVFSLVIIRFVMIYTTQQAVKQSVLRDFEKIAVISAQRVAGFIHEPKNLLFSTASIVGTLHAKAWQVETALIELGLNYDFFEHIDYLDLQGKKLASSRPGRNFSNKSLNINTLKTQNYFLSEIYFSDKMRSFIDLAVPVKFYDQTVGVLYAQVSLAGIWEVVDQISFGKTGQAFVTSEKGVFIAHPDKKKVLANEKWPYFTAIKQDVAGIELSDQILAYAKIPSLNWLIVVSQAKSEALAYLIVVRVIAHIIILIMIVLVLVLSILLSRKIVSPIRLLVEGSKEVAKGNFEKEVPISRADEIGELIASFNQMVRDLKAAKDQEKLALVGKAAAAIVHDLKNSVMLVHTYISLFPQRYKNPEFIHKFIQIVPKELDQWLNMLKEIVDYTKNSGFKQVPLDLKEILKNLELLLAEKAHSQHIKFDMKLTSEELIIKGNLEKLKQVLINLSVNALEAMPKGGALTIKLKRLTPSPGDNYHVAEILIQDTGEGMTSEVMARIFEPFHTTKTNGLGLGLSICKETISKHHGKIFCSSVPQQGTIFTIHLPLT
jgi:signal transduction histidine kinase